jgi:hypothetical protein
MISFNSTNTSQQFHTGILVNRHITVQAAADVTGYNKYLRRILRSGMLKSCKIDHMWLIEVEDALEAYLQHVENTSDCRWGPK